MKRLFTLLFISFAALSCETGDEKLDDLLDKRDWVVFAEGTELSVDVPSKQTVLNYKFESTLDWEVKTDAEWLEIDPTSGTAGKNIKIQIKVAKNKDKEGRTGYADLTLSNDESYRITINQAGEGDENENIVVDIPHNQIWYTSTDGEIVEPYSGEKNDFADALTTFGVNIVSNTYADGKGVIEFEGDVTTIGHDAFYNCTSLTSITIPDSVTTIELGAFYFCDSLISVTIPDSVTTIGEYAFYDCSNLTSVTIPDSVTEIGYAAFAYCSNLTNVTIPDSVTEIGYAAFAYCSSLTSVTIGDSVTAIGDGAFAGCSSLQEFKGKFASKDGRCLIVDGTLISFAPAGLTEYTIPDSVTTIGDYAFESCSSLTSVTIPDSVTTIGYAAFTYCSSLTSITIPDSVTSIGDAAFTYCSSLTSVTIGDSVTTIGDMAFRGCYSLTSVTIPDSVTTIGYATFAYCENLKTVYCKAINPPTTIVNNNGYWVGFAKEDESGNICNIDCTIYVPAESVNAYKSAEGWSEYADDIVGYDFDRNEEVVQPDVIPNNQIWYTSTGGMVVEPYSQTAFNVSIVSNIYENGHGIISFDGDVTTISDSAFEGCSSLTSVTIPDSVTTIGSWAFEYCSNLTSVTIGDSVTTIGSWAFESCNSLTSITIPDSVTTIGDNAFYDCSSLSSVTIGDSVTTIGDAAFECCSSLTSVTIPDSVTTIGYGAFSACSSLTSVTIPNSVTKIGDYAFDGCSSLTSITIPDSVTTIGYRTFYYCTSLTSVTIGNSVTKIGEAAFCDCTSLTSVNIPDSVTTIGGGAFASCGSLIEFSGKFAEDNGRILIIDGVLTAFASAGITQYTIPDSVTMIGDGAFYYCSSLTSVTIPDSVTTIGNSAFYYCSSLTSVYCKPTTPPTVILDYYYDWCAFDENSSGRKIYVPAGSTSAYKSAQGWSEYADAIVGYDFDRNEEVVQPEQPEEIPNNQIWYTSTDGEIVEPYSGVNNNNADALTTFGANIVSNTYVDGKGVIEFDGDVTEIGRAAFLGCHSLRSVAIPDSVTTIGRGAFYDCNSLTSVTIPDSVTSIENSAFYHCESLTSVTIGNSVTSIGVWAFYACTSLTSITIPGSVTEIGEEAFYYCTSLTSVTIGNSVTKIGDYAFEDCSSLTSFYGKFASFDNRCLIANGKLIAFAPAGLTEYTIPDSVTAIGGHAFGSCESLTSITIPDSVTEIGERAFYYCESLTSITIPDSVTEIGTSAFYWSTSLTSVTIGNSVTEIGEGVFQYCTSLKEVYCKPTTPPTGGSSMFYDNVPDRTIYVPMESVEAYKSASYWRCYADDIVGYNF